MIDFAKITLKAGDGGSGGGSFEHIKGKRRGKADGGDGGPGGNIYLVATNDLNTLEPFRYVKEYKAKNGGLGLSKRRKGAEGDDLVVKVPVGTTIELIQSEKVEYDLSGEGQKILIARGGEAGRGNSHLKDEFGRRPTAGEAGEEGEVIEVKLELKLIADVGLIGFPNAGKSTILSKITSATPKIANYPFTTLEPNLGVMDSGGGTRIVLADIPGLIEGASQGRGLGDLFLRHIERTKILVHVIDISDVSTEEGIFGRYKVLRDEIGAYSKDLLKKREIIALNKIDLVSTDQAAKFLDFFRKKKKRTIALSALSNVGLGELKTSILGSLKAR